MLTHRNTDICCVQESRWKGGSARKKDTCYKFFWQGDVSGLGGVDIF